MIGSLPDTCVRNMKSAIMGKGGSEDEDIKEL